MGLDMLDSDRLEVFVAVAAAGGFTAGARALGRSQPAVHSQVKLLEDELGLRLYRKAGRGIVLTDAGRTVAAHGRELQTRSRALREALGGAPAGPVRLATGAGACRYLIADALKRAVADGIEVQLEFVDATGAVARVRDGRAALAVTAVAPVADLDALALARVGVGVLLPDGHPLVDRYSLAVGELAGAALILPPEGRPLRQAVDLALREAKVDVQRPVSAGSWSMAVHLGTLGLGIPVVADMVTVPAGHAFVPLEGLPVVTQRVLWRPGALSGRTARLHAHLAAVATRG